MSVFDVLKNNIENDVDTITMSYVTYGDRLREAQLEERQRILDAVQVIENRSHATRTPLFQDTLFELVRKAING